MTVLLAARNYIAQQLMDLSDEYSLELCIKIAEPLIMRGLHAYLRDFDIPDSAAPQVWGWAIAKARLQRGLH